MLDFYAKKMLWLMIPSPILQWYKARLETKFSQYQRQIESRLTYYCKLSNSVDLPKDISSTYVSYKRKGNTSYYYDLKEFIRYFPKSKRFAYHFGDETHINNYPTLFKARPIEVDNTNSVLFKLDSPRHFRFIDDKKSFRDKKNLALFRGAVHGGQKHRVLFMEKMFNNTLVNAGQSNLSPDYWVKDHWQKPFMSIEEQLNYKFIICLEGNDVASNLKWAMSSNSVVITPKMKFETWFMEGSLKPEVHYIEVKDDWSDFDEKIAHYLMYPEEAEAIICNAHRHVALFLNPEMERLLCIKTLERYFQKTGQ